MRHTNLIEVSRRFAPWSGRHTPDDISPSQELVVPCAQLTTIRVVLIEIFQLHQANAGHDRIAVTFEPDTRNVIMPFVGAAAEGARERVLVYAEPGLLTDESVKFLVGETNHSRIGCRKVFDCMKRINDGIYALVGR